MVHLIQKENGNKSCLRKKFSFFFVRKCELDHEEPSSHICHSVSEPVNICRTSQIVEPESDSEIVHESDEDRKKPRRRSFGKRIKQKWVNFRLLKSSEKIVEFASGFGEFFFEF